MMHRKVWEGHTKISKPVYDLSLVDGNYYWSFLTSRGYKICHLASNNKEKQLSE